MSFGKILVLKEVYQLRRKSQAALEFLTTYAWAFLVILIMVGALAYFGILNPSKLLPDRCNFGSEIACDKNRMIVNNINDGTLTMRMTNNFGTAVVVTSARVTADIDQLGTCTVQIYNAPISEFQWPSGNTSQFGANCTGGNQLVEKEKIKMNIEIDYHQASADSSYTKTVFGEIFTAVQ